MPITELPVLPASYPLFDWADWPASYAALVPGGPTKAFEKACWNAIVGYVEEVVEATGLTWRDGVQNPEEIMMRKDGYVRFTAAQMNSLCRAVDGVITLPWRWEYDKAFRGYLGRSYFWPSKHTVQDILYPEYFTEMVNHINKIVEILRGTSDMEVSSDVLQTSFSNQKAQAELLRSGNLMPWNQISRASVSLLPEAVTLGDLIDFPQHYSRISVSGPDWLQGGIIYKYLSLHSGVSVRGDKARANPSSAQLKMSSLQYAALDYLMNTLETSAQLWMRSKAAASVQTVPTVGMYADILTRSDAAVALSQGLPLGVEPSGIQAFFQILSPELKQILPYEITSLRHLAFTRRSVLAAKSQAFPIAPKTTAVFGSKAVAVKVPSLPTSAEQISESIRTAEVTPLSGAPIHAEAPAKIRTQNPVMNYRTAPVFTEAPTATKASCAIYLYNGWDYPEWVDGGLWIRQAHTITQYENGELEVR